MRLVEQARSIFANLGYTVEGAGPEFRAEREWKVVHVSPVLDAEELPTVGDFRCFVARREDADALEGRLRTVDPDYEWAIIVVDDDGEEYKVERAPPGPVVSA